MGRSKLGAKLIDPAPRSADDKGAAVRTWNQPGKDITCGGARLHVAEAGEGKPLLLLTGIGGHVNMWRPLVERLVPHGIRAISFDHPGTGESTNYRRPRRIRGIAKTVEKLLDRLEHEQVDVLGVSYGGGIAQQLAHQAPDRVRRLILCATSAGMISLPGRPHALWALATPRRFSSEAYYQRIAPTVFGGRARNEAELVEHSQERFTQPPSAIGYTQQMLAAVGWTSFRWLPQLKQPTLVLHGDDDPLVPLLNGRLLAARIPSARLHIVRGGGHLLLLDQVEDAVTPIVDFLST